MFSQDLIFVEVGILNIGLAKGGRSPLMVMACIMPSHLHTFSRKETIMLLFFLK